MNEQDETNNKKIGRPRGTGNEYPRVSLEKCILFITKLNVKRKYSMVELAEITKQSPSSSSFMKMARSAYNYGLTTGSYTQKPIKISLSHLGESIAYPESDDNVEKLKFAAFKKIEIYTKLVDNYSGKEIEIGKFQNTLVRSYDISEQNKKKCAELFINNLRYLKMLKTINGKTYVNVDTEAHEANDVLNEELDSKQMDQNYNSENTSTDTQKSINKKIFVGHGKNADTLKQLKEILDKFSIPYKVAVDEPNQGRPISVKISELMSQCTSAIFLFTKDEETKDKEGNIIYRPSDNVVYELALASYLYENKIVIFKEEGVSLGSDFSDLGYISFKDNEISAKGIDLIKELIEFGLFKVNLT